MLGVGFVLEKGQCDMGMKYVICPLSKPDHSEMFCTVPTSPSGKTSLLSPSVPDKPYSVSEGAWRSI